MLLEPEVGKETKRIKIQLCWQTFTLLTLYKISNMKTYRLMSRHIQDESMAGRVS